MTLLTIRIRASVRLIYGTAALLKAQAAMMFALMRVALVAIWRA